MKIKTELVETEEPEGIGRSLLLAAIYFTQQQQQQQQQRKIKRNQYELMHQYIRIQRVNIATPQGKRLLYM